MTVAITVSWADSPEVLVPFPKKCPGEASALREGVQQGLLEVASHGLTHCVLKRPAFRPPLFQGNRTHHREFWDWVEPAVQHEHLQRAQDIIQSFFQAGDRNTCATGQRVQRGYADRGAQGGAALCEQPTDPEVRAGLVCVDPARVNAFHDRDVVRHGMAWLEDRLQADPEPTWRFVRELGAKCSQAAEQCSDP